MFWNFLAESAANATDGANQNSLFGNYATWIMLGVVAVLMIVYFIFSNRRRKKQEAEVDEMMNALVPGDKILTIGRWHGEIVEVLEDGMFVVKTGSDAHPGYVTIEKAAIAHIFKQETENAEATPDDLPPENNDVFEETPEAATETEPAAAEERPTELPTLGPADDKN